MFNYRNKHKAKHHTFWTTTEFFKVKKLTFNRAHKLKKEYPDYFVRIYQFNAPIVPGDTVRLTYKGTRRQTGFLNGSADAQFVANGTFITNTDIFPLTGYIRGFELQDLADRKKRGLHEAEGLPERSNQPAQKYSLFGGIGRTSLDVTVSTEPDQTVIVPGYLQKQWVKNKRAYFYYKTAEQVFPFFSVVSGRYKVKRDKYKNINLEVFYHPDHSYNVPVMMKSLKDGLAYNEANFSPYQYRQIRILEFPKYRSFAQSFPGTVPFSEDRGFLYQHDPEKLDMTYYVTAHELSHQWWGHQVGEANVKGGQMYSEGLAQYSALMLLKHQLAPVELSRYLKYELDAYLKGRSREQKKENSLYNTDNQPYVHYQKATLAYFYLQDLIGEEKINRALKKLLINYGLTDKYPTSDVLVNYLKAETPDSLQFVVDDLFKKITIFENRVINPTAKKVGAQYQVTIPIQTTKYYTDAVGIEKKTPIRDYIDVGIFTQDVNGKEKLVYLQKLKFSKDQTTVVIMVKDKPTKAGIDPIYKLIDRNTEDNQAVVSIN